MNVESDESVLEEVMSQEEESEGSQRGSISAGINDNESVTTAESQDSNSKRSAAMNCVPF